MDLEDVLEMSSGLMVQGGRVIITFEEDELGKLAGDLSFGGLFRWLFPLGYKLLVWRRSSDDSDYHLITACQYTCPTDDVLAHLYAEFPVNGVSTDPGIRIKDVPEADSPDAEHL
jgi:hypothetical protein